MLAVLAPEGWNSQKHSSNIDTRLKHLQEMKTLCNVRQALAESKIQKTSFKALLKIKAMQTPHHVNILFWLRPTFSLHKKAIFLLLYSQLQKLAHCLHKKIISLTLSSLFSF